MSPSPAAARTGAHCHHRAPTPGRASSTVSALGAASAAEAAMAEAAMARAEVDGMRRPGRATAEAEETLGMLCESTCTADPGVHRKGPPGADAADDHVVLDDGDGRHRAGEPYEVVADRQRPHGRRPGPARPRRTRGGERGRGHLPEPDEEHSQPPRRSRPARRPSRPRTAGSGSAGTVLLGNLITVGASVTSTASRGPRRTCCPVRRGPSGTVPVPRR